MQELSLNVLDIAQNSIKAKAKLIHIAVVKQTPIHRLTITVTDDGCGMSEEQVQKVTDPFFTTRKTRSVGLGIPFFKMSAEMTGGEFKIKSSLGVGTEITAVYDYTHLDFMPLGDMAATMVSLVSVNPDIDFVYEYVCDENGFVMDTREIKSILAGLPLNSPEVLTFIGEFIKENTRETDLTTKGWN